MQKNKLRVALVGAGMRPHQIFHGLLKIPGVELTAIYDANPKAVASRLAEWNVHPEICTSAEAAIERPETDLVAVFSPNACHADHIIRAFAAGKNVFSEKPLVTSLEDCSRVLEAHRASGKFFATGFVLRYTPIYRKVKELLDQGKIGRIISVDANENLNPRHGSYIMCNWRRFSQIAGPHILEKCCHDLDLLGWFIGDVPSKVASFGGCDFFQPENAEQYGKFLDPADGIEVFRSTWEETDDSDNPFLTEKDIFDNQVAILEYRNNVRVQFQATISNAIPERRMYISGTEGTLIVELFSGIVRLKRIDEPIEHSWKYETSIGHAGGDLVIMRDAYDMCISGKLPACGGREGMLSTATALAIHQAAEQKSVVDLEPVWKSFGI